MVIKIQKKVKIIVAILSGIIAIFTARVYFATPTLKISPYPAGKNFALP